MKHPTAPEKNKHLISLNQKNKTSSDQNSWELKGALQCHVYPQEIAGLNKGLLTAIVP